MVAGVGRFRDHFAGHEEQYVLIGGAACEPLMRDVGLDFRATKERDIKKHRNDVARLLQLLPADARFALPETLRADMAAFIAALDTADDFDPKQFKVDMTRDIVIERLRHAYDLKRG